MKSVLTKITLGAALSATALTAAAPASAQAYYGHRHDNTGTALIAGLAGLAIGAAIVSSADHRRDDYGYRYYDRRYGEQPVRYGYDRDYQSDYNRGYYRQNYSYDYNRGGERGWYGR